MGSSNSPQRTDHLWKVKAQLTDKETRDWPVRLMSLVGLLFAKPGCAPKMNESSKVINSWANGSHDMYVSGWVKEFKGMESVTILCVY